MRKWIDITEAAAIDINTITREMRDRLVAEYKQTPREINTGRCMEFCEELEREHPDLFESLELGNFYNHNYAAGEDAGDATGFDVELINRFNPNWRLPADFSWEEAFNDCGLNWTGTHVWAYCQYNGLCYDIENVEGVQNVFDLDFFKRIFDYCRSKRNKT